MPYSFTQVDINANSSRNEKGDVIKRYNGRVALIKDFHHGSRANQWLYGTIRIIDDKVYTLTDNPRLSQDDRLKYHDLEGLMIATD